LPVSFERHRAQIVAILEGWGTPPANAAVVADGIAWADLRGVKSHGISKLPGYDVWRRDGRIRVAAAPRIERETPVSALIDGDGGLGYAAGRLAMQTAVAKARTSGIGAVSVRNSAHFGACGFYTEMAVQAGLIGLTTTGTAACSVAPTFGGEARLGTDPISFGAPAEGDDYFLLDMATTTVAQGKILNLFVENRPCPPGWILDAAGAPSTDTRDYFDKGGFITSLGGSAIGASYKGYGLAVMVNILSACLSGSSLITDPLHARRPGHPNNIGHFFLALDPGLFRDPADFRRDVSTLIDSLRATRPLDGAVPVMVAGDPERKAMAKHAKEGIAVAPNMKAKIRQLAEEAGAPWLLEEEAA
jgi:LDH2 family malate/lactate/ureidoglycolate dehydrogenase